MANLQEVSHGEGFDYERGSPHLKHAHLRAKVSDSLRRSAQTILGQRGECRVLEIGAGHGDFTDVLLGTGASVTVTEMSRPSAQVLQSRYQRNPRVEVVVDHDGDWIFNTDRPFDMVAAVSVLHHIPDYLSFIGRAVELLSLGGSFVSWQDPLYYPRRSQAERAADRIFYLAWRLGQGELSKGVSTRWRRVRGVYDESNPSDMVEYHVVRDGVDEEAIRKLLEPKFGEVRILPYWSTQSRMGQRIGDRLGLETTFGIVADQRRD